MTTEAEKVIADLTRKNDEAHDRLMARCNEMTKQLQESAKVIGALTDLLKAVLLCHRAKKFADAEKALTNYFGDKGGMN